MMMALSSIQLDAFLTLSQTLNFTRAAEQLHITQSALSQRIQNLEAELETTLFLRDRAGLQLTPAARELVQYCRHKSTLEEEYLAGLKGHGVAGVLRIGGFSSVMHSVILPSLAPLLAGNAQIKLHMIVDEIAHLPSLLRRGEVDYIITTHFEETENLERVLLGSEVNVLTQKRKYKGPDIYLDHDENDRTTFDYLKPDGKRAKPPERRFLDDIHGLIAGVQLGIGRAVLPRHLIRKNKEIEIINPARILEVPVYLYYYSQPFYSKLHTQITGALTNNAKEFLRG